MGGRKRARDELRNGELIRKLGQKTISVHLRHVILVGKGCCVSCTVAGRGKAINLQCFLHSLGSGEGYQVSEVRTAVTCGEGLKGCVEIATEWWLGNSGKRFGVTLLLQTEERDNGERQSGKVRKSEETYLKRNEFFCKLKKQSNKLEEILRRI